MAAEQVWIWVKRCTALACFPTYNATLTYMRGDINSSCTICMGGGAVDAILGAGLDGGCVERPAYA